MADYIQISGKCVLDNGGCSLTIDEQENFIHERLKRSVETEFGEGILPFQERINNRIVSGGVINSEAMQRRKLQTFLEKNVYCLFEGALDIHYDDGTFQKVLPSYTTSNWTSYSDIWSYNKLCRIGAYRATLFSVLYLNITDVTQYDIKVRIVENEHIVESVPPNSLLAVSLKIPGRNLETNESEVFWYTFHNKQENVSKMIKLSEHSNTIDIRTTDRCYLILLTPKS